MGKRIGYGFGRSPRDFDGLDCATLWLDGPQTDRSERETMLRLDVRDGDVIVLLAPGDLGAGRGLANIKALIAEKGATIEIAEREPRAPGRPPACDLTDEQAARFGGMWRDLAVDGGYIVTKACEAAGVDPKDRRARHRLRQMLTRRFGARRTKEAKG